MTYAANVLTGYVLVAAAVVTYALWLVRRGRALGRDLGIGKAGSAGDPSSETSQA